METQNKLRDFYAGHRVAIKITLSVIMALLFAGSIILSVFIGGEFTQSDASSDTVKGLIRLEKSSYGSTYFAGDSFAFDKDAAEVTLVAKDPLLPDIVRVDDLPATEYGFQANGEGEIYDEASEITMSKGITEVSLVSKAYPDVKLSLPVKVYASLDESKLTNEYTFEAENGDLYSAAGELLTREQMTTLPDTNKPYISSAGSTVAGENCSGGAVLRNFSKGMQLKINVVSSANAEVSLTILCCKRPSANLFGNYYNFTVNGNAVEEIDSQTVPADANKGYYEQFTLQTVTVKLVRGVNVLSFTGLGSTANLDAVRITADGNIIGDISAVTE